MAVSEQRLIEYAAELGSLGVPKQLIKAMVEIQKLDLPRATPSLYKGLERHYDFLRESFLLGLVKQCVGKKIGKRFKDADSASRHIKVCLECQAEIINFIQRTEQEFSLTKEQK